MSGRGFTIYLLRAALFGLAIAFVLLMIWPEMFRSVAPPLVAVENPSKPVPEVPHRSTMGPLSYAGAVERAAPAVVNINTAKVVSAARHPLFDDPLFHEFFGRGNSDMLRPNQRVERSLGSGVITSAQGYILTNLHVIKGADAIQVSLRDGRIAAARVIGSDSDTDLAVLKIELPRLPTIALGNSERLRVGDVVLAIGNPFGVGQTVTMGIVSATGRHRLGISTYENFIQTDAAINPGNSGGALIDAEGNLVGINTAIFSQSGGYQGVGFAIPTSLARTVLDQIVTYGHPVRGWLGIEAYPIPPDQAETLKLEPNEGVRVVAVMRNGPAHLAGIQPGDILRTINGKKIHEIYSTVLLISNLKPGSKVQLGVLRDETNLTLEAIATERPIHGKPQ